jgi:NAD(P)-dependent dehydrogenase (short-subunit alcohol dehydrogenase family)
MGGHAGVAKEGYENQFGTNHVGHTLLLKLLTSLVLQTAEECKEKSRVIFTSSKGHVHAAALPKDGIAFA